MKGSLGSIKDLKNKNQAILDSIPEECELTLEHVQVHLASAEEAEEDDKDQFIHDLDLAGRILLSMVYKMELAEGRYN